MTRGLLRTIIANEERERRKVVLTFRKHHVLAFAFSIVAGILVFQSPDVKAAILASANLGYIGALFAGLFFAYGFTTPIAVAVFVLLGQSLNPVLLGLIGGLGATFSDWTMFTLFRKTLVIEIRKFSKNPQLKEFKRSVGFRFLRWMTPLAAGFIIASPLPDELAIALFGISAIKTKRFLVLSYVFNAIGLMVIAGLGKWFM